MSQWTIRKGWEADAQIIAEISFEAYRLCKDWAILCPNVKSEDWVDVQTDLVLQHFSSPNDVVAVAEDEKGDVVGYIYGRVVGEGLSAVAKRKPLAGRNMSAVGKRGNDDFVHSMLDKYGRLFWVRDFAVLPDKQGGGAGKAMLSYVTDEAKRREGHIALAGGAEAVGLYKKFGFIEITPPRMVEGTTIPLTNQMLLEIFPVLDG